MDFIIQNWEWFLLGFMVADKIVSVTPNKYDDIIVTAIKSAFKKVCKKS